MVPGIEKRMQARIIAALSAVQIELQVIGFNSREISLSLRRNDTPRILSIGSYPPNQSGEFAKGGASSLLSAQGPQDDKLICVLPRRTLKYWIRDG